MSTNERSTPSSPACVFLSSDPERIMLSVISPPESFLKPTQQDIKHDVTPTPRSWEALLTNNRDDAEMKKL